MKITVQELLDLKDVLVVDIRSPAEFKEAHIPNAINIPLFSNEERAVVGTLYKQEGRNKAIVEGVNIFSKKLPEMMNEYFKFRNKRLVIYCWRGGMRSKIINNLLDSVGFWVRQLDGGHKAFRKHVLRYFNEVNFKPKLYVLHGLTGCGKTEILQKLKDKHPIIDLEGLAQHRSSLLGSIALKPNTQQMFDALLFFELRKLEDEKYIFIEGESRKIGKVQMPDFLWNKMKKSDNIRVNCSMENRVKRLSSEYVNSISEKDINLILEVMDSLRQKLSNELVDELKKAILDKRYLYYTKQMLEHYYDPLYSFSINKLSYLTTIDNNNETKAIEALAKLN